MQLSSTEVSIWIFGLVGTDYDVVGVPSVATEYIVGILLMIHAVLVFVLSLVYRSTSMRLAKYYQDKKDHKQEKPLVWSFLENSVVRNL